MPRSLFVRRLLRVLLGLFLGALVVAAYTLYLVRTQGEVAMQPPAIETTLAAPAFDLVDQHGRRFTNADLEGKVWVADFIFTNCPDFCPVLTANMLRLQRQLASEGVLGDDVMLVSFSVDPIADTPEVLYRYAEAYGADQEAWRFLTGPFEYLDEVLVDGFFVAVTHIYHDDPDGHGQHGEHADHGAHHTHTDHHDVPPPYDIVHSNRFVVVDRHGNVQGYHDGEQLDLEALMHDIRFLVERG